MKDINIYKKRRFLFTPSHISTNDIKVALGNDSSPKLIKNVLILLHRIITRSISHKSKSDQHTEEYIQINRKERRFILGRDYVRHTELLINKAIIDVATLEITNPDDGSLKTVQAYGKGHSCKKYGIPEYKWFKRVEVTDDDYIVKKLDHLLSYRTEEHDVYGILQTNTALLKLEESAKLKNTITIRNAEKGIKMSGDIYVALFNSQETPVSVDDFGNRFHAKHTTLKREFRAYLMFENHESQALVNVDLVNSQPLLLSIISPALIVSLAEECKDAIPILQKYYHNKDYEKFRSLCQAGKIYEYIIDGFKSLYGMEIDRNIAKNVFYYACFSKYYKRPELIGDKVKGLLLSNKGLRDKNGINEKRMKLYSHNFIQNYFPSLFNFNLELKKLDWRHLVGDKKTKYKRHANTPLLAQRIESALLLKNCGWMMHQAGIVFTTIHDSFLILEQDIPKVKKIIKATFRGFGLAQPKLKVEELVRVNAQTAA